MNLPANINGIESPPGSANRNSTFSWKFDPRLSDILSVPKRSSSVSSARGMDSPTSSTSFWLSHNSRRQQALASLQTMCTSAIQNKNGKFNCSTFCNLFSKKEVHALLFQLFDDRAKGKIAQTELIDFLNDKLGMEGREFVELFDTLAYVVAKDADLDFLLFSRILQTEKLLVKLYKLIDTDGDSHGVSAERVMVFVMDVSLIRHRRHLQKVRIDGIEELFNNLLSNGAELSLEDFKKLIPSNDAFFAERVFSILDKDNSKSVSAAELRAGLDQLCSQSTEDRVRFLFRIYDRDEDGLIRLDEVKAVMKACIQENQMNFSEEQLDQLALALYEDALDSVDSELVSAKNGLEFEHLKAQLDKHPGLIDELSFSLERFLLPSTPRFKRKKRPTHRLQPYLRNNASYFTFLTTYIFVNIALLITRAIEYSYMERPDNGEKYPLIYILARAFGQALNFNCAFIVVLMLRRCITWMRQTRLAVVLPLDRHIYLHKICGLFIVLFGSLHTVMHLINFPLNVANNWTSNATHQTHTAIEWLFTTTPKMFGLIPGVANLTGWGLLLVLIIMIPCSLPFVRKTGYFELFYWTHLLHFPFFVLLIFHGSHFWHWFVLPGTLFLLEKLGRVWKRRIGKGRTFIQSAVLLPSRVTHLVCRKPSGFHFHPGDYVYVNIPAIASSEWHPFTISSAPELPDVLWLHIRGVGGWTNKLYEYFKSEQAKLNNASQANIQNYFPSSQHLLDENPSNLVPTTSKQFSRQVTVNDTRSETEHHISHSNLSTMRPTLSHQISIPWSEASTDSQAAAMDVTHAGYRYMRRPPNIINLPVPTNEVQANEQPNFGWRRSTKTPRETFAPETVRIRKRSVQRAQTNEQVLSRPSDCEEATVIAERNIPSPLVEGVPIYHPLEITVDGPYGTPSSHIFRAEHAVLIAAGIGVTPFASILQSIMHRYYASLHKCPQCQYSWSSGMPESIVNLQKVDFFWINRDQRSFEWFVHILSQLEMEQAERGGVLGRFLDLHMYITSALKKTDIKAVGLQMALDLLHAKEKRDLVTGLKTRTNAGRPNWDKVFQKIVDEDKGKVTVFYCGPPQLARELREKCNKFGFDFRKEIF